jgi:hypothetical protein
MIQALETDTSTNGIGQGSQTYIHTPIVNLFLTKMPRTHKGGKDTLQ